MHLGVSKYFFVDKVVVGTYVSLSLKGLVEKVYRAFTVSVGNLVRFSFVALYLLLIMTSYS